MSSGTNRIKWVDTFRGMMIFFIAFGHTARTGDLKDYVYSFHVAAFFFISGYLFSVSNLSFKQFAWKKFKSLMVPYYVFAIISIFIFSVLGSFASDKLDIAIKSSAIPFNIVGMLWANGCTGYMKWNLPLWFIPCLFATTLVAYPLEKWINRRRYNRTLAYLLVAIFAMALSVLNYKVLHFYKLPFQLETLIFMMPFFSMGLIYRELSKSRNCNNPIIGAVLIIIGYILAVHVNTHVEYFASRYGNIYIFYFAAAISIIGYISIAKLFSPKVLCYLGQNTLPVLLMHKFPIVALQVIFGSYINQTDDIVSIIVTILITIISCVACLIVDIPLKRYVPFIYGYGRKRKVNRSAAFLAVYNDNTWVSKSFVEDSSPSVHDKKEAI